MFVNYYQTRPRSPMIWICVQLPWLRAFGQFAAQTWTRSFNQNSRNSFASRPSPIHFSSSWNGPSLATTNTVDKKGIDLAALCLGRSKVVRPHKWGFWVIIRFLGFWGPKVREFRHYSPSKQSNTWIIWKTPKETYPPQRGRVSKPEVEFFAASHYSS